MANQDAPFGLRPIKMVGGGDFTGGQDRFTLASGYNTNIFQGSYRTSCCGNNWKSTCWSDKSYSWRV